MQGTEHRRIYSFMARVVDCPLCKALQTETPLAQNKDFIVLRTKAMKGHKERIMIVFRAHTSQLLEITEWEGERYLEQIGKELFKSTFFLILDPTYATISDHWHLVASDLDKNADDYDQVLCTKWRKIVSTNDDN